MDGSQGSAASSAWGEVAARLDLGPQHAAAWASTWDASTSWAATDPHPVVVGDRLDDEMARCEVPDAAHHALRDAAAWAVSDPAAQRLVQHLQWMIAGTGRPLPQPLLESPALPPSAGDPGRLLDAVVVLSLLDAGRTAHQRQGVPGPIIEATFTEVGAKVREHREVHGTWGFTDLAWLTWHLAGQLWRVGRLQHQASLRWQPLADESNPLAPPLLSPVVDLHIPAGSPLDPDAVDRSLADADRLLRQIRPALAHAPRVCWSWLLDPVLLDLVAPGSNLAHFASRFHHLPLAEHFDPRLRLFVFRVPDDVPTSDLPRGTSLQRSAADHLAAGGQWGCSLGVLRD